MAPVPCLLQNGALSVSFAKTPTVYLRADRSHRPVFRDQELSIQEQLDIARHFGPLHKHATTPVPREPGLEEVHGNYSSLPHAVPAFVFITSLVVYNDGSRRPDPSAFSKFELWHSDVTYELQPPSTTSLKVLTGPEYGGDTLWSSGYAFRI